MGDLTERCAVLERERADLYMRHTGLLEEIRDLRAYKKATAARLAALDEREELEASDWGDEAAWDLAVTSARKHKSRMLAQMRKCLTRACARRLGDGNCVASCPKKFALLEAFLCEDYLP